MSLSDLVMKDGYPCPKCKRGNLSCRDTPSASIVECDTCGWKKETKKDDSH